MSGVIPDGDLERDCETCGEKGYRHCPHCAGSLDDGRCDQFAPSLPGEQPGGQR